MPAIAELQVPAEWGELPLTAPLEVEVQWVHTNGQRCISYTHEGRERINLFAARNPAPSEGAIRLMFRAASDPKSFDDLFKSVKKGESEDGSEKTRTERRSIAEVEKVLEKYLEGK